jgi:hypothetical protein
VSSADLRPAIPAQAGPVEPATPEPDVIASPRDSTPARHRRLAVLGRLASDWRARPATRLVLPGVLILGTLVVSGVSGAYLVPRASHPARAGVGIPSASGGQAPTTAPPAVLDPSQPGATAPAPITGRPADGLAAWAAPLVTKVQDIPQVALEAYGYAELRLAQQRPSCQLRWTTLAGIGKVESNHGRANGATLRPDGKALPPIIGPALDGTSNRQRITDTDLGGLDGDRTWDHAIGPMQFIPSTWQTYQIDADNDGTADPNDIDDAALAAANYLCSGGQDLSTAGGWWAAILAYNAVQQYAQTVFDSSNSYGERSH